MASNSTVSLRLKILTEGLQDLIDVTNETGELGDEAERLLDLSKPYVRALQEEARAHAKTSKSLSEKNKELKKVTAAANRAEKELRKTKQQLEEFGKKADLSAKATAQLKTALAGIGVALVAREFVRANSALEQLTRSLTIVEGSAEGGAEQLQFLREEAERLGLRVGELGSEYLKFTAALAGTNLEGEKGREIFTNFAESLANIGADTQRVSLVLTALGQIASKGVISMEELRQQLGDSLPGAVRLLADAIGVSVAELTKLIEAGEVSSDRLLEFSRAAAKAYGADGVSAIRTYSAAVGRLGNAIDGLLQKIGNTGAFEALRRTIEASAASIRGLTDLLFGAQKPADDIKDLLSKYDAETGESLKQTAENVKGIADAARGGIPEILELKEVIENLGKSSKGEDLEINLSVDTLERIIETIEKKISDMRLSLRRPLQVDTSEFLSELRQAESEADRFRNLLDLIREKADQAPTGALAGSIAEQTKEAEKEVRRLSDALDRANEAA